MPCYRPITAWKPLDGGALVFSEKKNCREVKVNCSQCIGCRLDLREAWALRCWAESRMHANSWFITPTYAPEFLPANGSLVPDHLSDFIRALRRKTRLGALRFFGVGEYGERLERPHYHVLVFGPDIPDLRKVNSVFSKEDVFRSELVSAAWPHGDVVIGRATLASARYVAGYVVKKYRGKDVEDHFSRVDDATGEIVSIEPEFSRMSRRPGIGYAWLEKYWRDLYSVHDSMIVAGKRHKVPQYFADKMDAVLGDAHPGLMDEVDFRRAKRGELRADDSTRERLAVREQCALARIEFYEGR